MSVHSMQDLLLDVMKDLYDAEKRITKALPKMMKAAESGELIGAFESHLRETEAHVTRLERAFEAIDASPGRKICQAMVGLIREGEEMIQEVDEGPVRDAALIAAAQKVEHYEMASYGCLRDWARKLGHDAVVRLAEQTIEEEGAADRRLTEIAQSLNLEAIEEGEMAGSTRHNASRAASPKRGNGGSRGRASGSRSKH